MVDTIIQGDALTVLKTLPDEFIDCCVTSPPYWGLRDYGVECQLGLEKTPEEYVAKMVEVFREVRRVLKKEGTCWVNLGDSYWGGKGQSGQAWSTEHTDRDTLQKPYHQISGMKETRPSDIRPNVCNILQGLIENSVLFIGSGGSLTISPEGKNILHHNNGLPEGELPSLLGVKRITIKQRDNDFCQVFDLLHPEAYRRICLSMPFSMVDQTNAEILLDVGQRISIVVSQGDLDADSSLGISIRSLTAENSNMAFTIKEPAKPTTETIRNRQTTRDTISGNPIGKSSLNINIVDKPIPFGNAFMPTTKGLGNFSVTEASKKHFTLSLMNGVIKFTCRSVGHIFASNSFGSLMRYIELYDKAYRKSNYFRAKQEVGIPFLVRQALMEDGWICRSTIIWHKPNPMPESVTDRCTKAHEYVFLMSKTAKYYYDQEAIKEPVKDSSVARLIQDVEGQQGSSRVPGKTNGPMKAVRFGGNKQCPDTRLQSGKEWNPKMAGGGTNISGHAGYFKADGTPFNGLMVNKKSVWTITTKPFKEAHFATFPEDLIRPMILAGCPEGGIVLDPFIGSGTVARVAVEHRRHYIGIDLNTQYVEMAEKRRQVTQRMF